MVLLLKSGNKQRVKFKKKEYIKVTKKVVLLSALCVFTALSTFAQNKTLRGVVVTEKNTPLSGATIAVGTTNIRYLVADKDGNFEIENIEKWPLQIVITYASFRILDTAILSNVTPPVRFVLKPDDKLQEVVVIGYGKSTREKLTGSVSKISGKTITDQPVMNPILALQGRAAGVSIGSITGNLGPKFL